MDGGILDSALDRGREECSPVQHVQTSLAATEPPIQRIREIFPRGKATGT